MDVTVIGCGYVGLVTAACLAELGHHVTCIDKNHAKIEQLKNGFCPIYEPGLTELLPLLKFSTELVIGDITFITVGTPANEDGSCNTDHVFQAAKEIGNSLQSTILVTKSTVPIGSAKKIAFLAPRAHIVSNPEFLREGQAIDDFRNPDRIVIGTDSTYARVMMERLYDKIKAPILHTSAASAELIKYASNGFLAMKLAYINELSWLASDHEADIEQVTAGMGMDKRIGHDYLKVGPGFGGSCFPKDIASLAAQSGSELVQQIIISNDRHQTKIACIINDCGANKIGILGTAFKADTDDIRESPALAIIPLLRGEIKTYDPKALCSHSFDEVMQCDIIVIMTEWEEFRHIKTDKLIIDLRNLNSPSENYHCLGRKQKSSQFPLVRGKL